MGPLLIECIDRLIAKIKKNLNNELNMAQYYQRFLIYYINFFKDFKNVDYGLIMEM